jgi:hypothetical protein
MDIISHLTVFFNEEKIQSYIVGGRKELECPDCGSEDIGSWEQYHRLRILKSPLKPSNTRLRLILPVKMLYRITPN